MANLQIHNFENYQQEICGSMLSETFLFMNEQYRKFYPNFREWFFGKVCSDVIIGKRRIYLVTGASSSNIYGVSIVKFSSTLKHHKICSFYLSGEASGMGLGNKLMHKIENDCRKENMSRGIRITVPEERTHKGEVGRNFEEFLHLNGFNRIAAIRGRYRVSMQEHIFEKPLMKSYNEN